MSEGRGFKSQLCHFLVVWPWASYLTSLSDIFLTCKMRIMILTLKNCGEDQVRDHTSNARVRSGAQRERQLFLSRVHALDGFLAGRLCAFLCLPNCSRDFWGKGLYLSCHMGGGCPWWGLSVLFVFLHLKFQIRSQTGNVPWCSPQN